MFHTAILTENMNMNDLSFISVYGKKNLNLSGNVKSMEKHLKERSKINTLAKTRGL